MIEPINNGRPRRGAVSGGKMKHRVSFPIARDAWENYRVDLLNDIEDSLASEDALKRLSVLSRVISELIDYMAIDLEIANMDGSIDIMQADDREG